MLRKKYKTFHQKTKEKEKKYKTDGNAVLSYVQMKKMLEIRSSSVQIKQNMQ